LYHLVEGCSIRSTERITGVHRDTILKLLVAVGEKCEHLWKHASKESQLQTFNVTSYGDMSG
jgi:hypothetical protein